MRRRVANKLLRTDVGLHPIGLPSSGSASPSRPKTWYEASIPTLYVAQYSSADIMGASERHVVSQKRKRGNMCRCRKSVSFVLSSLCFSNGHAQLRADCLKVIYKIRFGLCLAPNSHALLGTGSYRWSAARSSTARRSRARRSSNATAGRVRDVARMCGLVIPCQTIFDKVLISATNGTRPKSCLLNKSPQANTAHG
jgi:hypothetical protein